MRARQFMLKPWCFIGFSTLIACSASSLQPAGPDSSVTPTPDGSADAGTPDGPADVCATPPASALCAQNPTGPVVMSTIADVVTAMTGRWLLCGNESAFAVDGGDIGLEITADNHWYKLYAAEGAATVRGAGFDEEGTWEAIDLGDHIQVNFAIFGSGTVITAPVFASTPRAMRLDNNGVFRGDYVIDPTVPTGDVRCAPKADLTRSGACTPPADTLIQACTIDQIFGRWSRCGGSMPGAPPHDGIELAANGSFFFLHADPSGGLVRGSSDTDSGTAMTSASSQCGANFTFTTRAGAYILSTSVIYQSTPRQLWIYTGPEWGDPERYTFVSP
jgi:hypothetical protein